MTRKDKKLVPKIFKIIKEKKVEYIFAIILSYFGVAICSAVVFVMIGMILEELIPFQAHKWFEDNTPIIVVIIAIISSPIVAFFLILPEKWNYNKIADKRILKEMYNRTEISDNNISETPIRCPNCKSTQLSTNKRGFSLGKAAAGGIITGGIGLLGGFIGSGKVKITCLKCGKSWTAGKS